MVLTCLLQEWVKSKQKYCVTIESAPYRVKVCSHNLQYFLVVQISTLYMLVKIIVQNSEPLAWCGLFGVVLPVMVGNIWVPPLYMCACMPTFLENVAKKISILYMSRFLSPSHLCAYQATWKFCACSFLAASAHIQTYRSL